MDISVALGGGGARGLAHIGVLQVLEAEGCRIRAIAGTSMGGIVAAGYAAGYSPDELKEWMKKAARPDMLRARPSQGGLLSLERVQEFLRQYLGERTFDDLRLPLALTATNLDTGQELVIRQGLVREAVMATIALPGIFPPKVLTGHRLVDGGALDPVPVLPARALFGGPVVAVALSPPPEEWAAHSSRNPLISAFPVLERFTRLRPGQALQVFLRSLEISARMFTELRLKTDRPEVVVRPRVWHIGLFDQPAVDEMVDIGAQAMRQALPELRRACRPWNLALGRVRRALEDQ